MSLFFIGGYVLLCLQEWGAPEWWPISVLLTQVSIASYAIIAARWRVGAGLHTVPQITVGALVGTANAALWFYGARGFVSGQILGSLGNPVPLPFILGLCGIGLAVVGSVERMIAKLWQQQQLHRSLEK